MMSHVKPAISTEQDALETNKEQETMISQKADTLLAQILSPLPRFESFKEQLERCDRFREFCDKNQNKINSRISKAGKDIEILINYKGLKMN